MSKLDRFAGMTMEEKWRAPVSTRRIQEQRDGLRVNEDHKAIANLSPVPMCKEFQIGFQVERLINPANED